MDTNIETIMASEPLMLVGGSMNLIHTELIRLLEFVADVQTLHSSPALHVCNLDFPKLKVKTINEFNLGSIG